jgi:hypothetical protein
MNGGVRIDNNSRTGGIDSRGFDQKKYKSGVVGRINFLNRGIEIVSF